MAPSISKLLTTYTVAAAAAGLAFAADENDWVNVNYVIKQAGSGASSDTSPARQSILSQAVNTAKQGPWSVTMSKVKPPSGDSRDYLSWAPYHWPNCNWCSKGANHFANPTGDGGSDEGSSDDGSVPDNDTYENGGIDDPSYGEESIAQLAGDASNSRRSEAQSAHLSHHRMRRISRGDWHHHETLISPAHPLHMHGPARRRADDPSPDPSATAADIPLPVGGPPPIPTQPPSVAIPQPNGSPTTTSEKGFAGTAAPAQAPAKTQKGTMNSCTPSPTKSLAPSATWTTCPYAVRDGKRNPDVDTVSNPSSAENMAQSVIHNAVAYTLQKSAQHSQNAANFIDTWFLSSTTGMHPNMNFAQVVRGPGKDGQMGTFTGVLDLRSLVKVVNAVQLLRATSSPDWTPSRDQAMVTWMKQYISWLQTSTIGKEVASKANNHLTFYIGQLAAAQILVGDTKGASTTLHNYFQKPYLDQIAENGEQPFEAVRTRPYHYRCFNLEAMIVNAKLGDQLGINFWSTQSKYKATIQTAVDHTMALDPKNEDVSDIFPHVAAAAAAYGDPTGKYQNFLKKKATNYKGEAFWFYDQTSALPNSPAAAKHKRATQDEADLSHTGDAPGSLTGLGDVLSSATSAQGLIPFECPAVFKDTLKTELEDGLFVTCDELKPFYEVMAAA